MGDALTTTPQSIVSSARGLRDYGDRELRLARFIVAVFSMALLFSVSVHHANAQEIAPVEDTALCTKTPYEWARSYAEVSHAMDVDKIMSLASDQVTLFYSNGNPQRTVENVQQAEELRAFYARFKDGGNRIAAEDYSIVQYSDDFAIVRFTWGITKAETNEVLRRVNSSYIIRNESDGWRFTGILEQGLPNGPQSSD